MLHKKIIPTILIGVLTLIVCCQLCIAETATISPVIYIPIYEEVTSPEPININGATNPEYIVMCPTWLIYSDDDKGFYIDSSNDVILSVPIQTARSVLKLLRPVEIIEAYLFSEEDAFPFTREGGYWMFNIKLHTAIEWEHSEGESLFYEISDGVVGMKNPLGGDFILKNVDYIKFKNTYLIKVPTY